MIGHAPVLVGEVLLLPAGGVGQLLAVHSDLLGRELPGSLEFYLVAGAEAARDNY